MAKTIIQFETTIDIWPLVDEWAKKEKLFIREASLFGKEEADTRTYVSGESGASLAAARIRIKREGNSIILEAWKSPLPLMEKPIDSFSLLGLFNPLLALSKGSFNRLLTVLNQPDLNEMKALKKTSSAGVSGGTRAFKGNLRTWTFIGLAVVVIGILVFAISSIQSNSVDINAKDPFTREPIATIGGQGKYYSKAVFSPDDKRLLTVSSQYQKSVIDVWDTATWKSIGSIQTGLSFIGNIAFNPDGHTLAMYDNLGGKGITLADMEDPTKLSKLKTDSQQGGLGQYMMIDYDPANGHLHTFFLDGVWTITSPEDGKILKEEKVGLSDTAVLSPDKGTLASTYFGTIKLSGKQTGEWKQIPGISTKTVFSPDGKNLAMISSSDVFLWHLDTGERKQISDIPVMKDITDMKFNPEGTRLVIGGNRINGNKGCLVVIDVKKDAILRAYSELGGQRPAFSYDLKKVALQDLKGYHIFSLSSLLK
ncbi:MAG: WD40 repeat domain-containing protein [Chloroflexi bacterium]|nr:WD40 repeat domain-containing protein [Chloroflexota bacterium]